MCHEGAALGLCQRLWHSTQAEQAHADLQAAMDSRHRLWRKLSQTCRQSHKGLIAIVTQRLLYKLMSIKKAKAISKAMHRPLQGAAVHMQLELPGGPIKEQHGLCPWHSAYLCFHPPDAI